MFSLRPLPLPNHRPPTELSLRCFRKIRGTCCILISQPQPPSSPLIYCSGGSSEPAVPETSPSRDEGRRFRSPAAAAKAPVSWPPPHPHTAPPPATPKPNPAFSCRVPDSSPLLGNNLPIANLADAPTPNRVNPDDSQSPVPRFSPARTRLRVCCLACPTRVSRHLTLTRPPTNFRASPSYRPTKHRPFERHLRSRHAPHAGTRLLALAHGLPLPVERRLREPRP